MQLIFRLRITSIAGAYDVRRQFHLFDSSLMSLIAYKTHLIISLRDFLKSIDPSIIHDWEIEQNVRPISKCQHEKYIYWL